MLRFITFLAMCNVLALYSLCQEAEISVGPTSCKGDNNGSITVSTKGYDKKYSIRVLASKNNRLIQEKIALEGDLETIFNGLFSEEYKIQIISNGQVNEMIASVEEPQGLKANAIIVEQYPSSDESCDGIIVAEPSGGTSPYNFLWSENTGSSKRKRLEDLCEGTYRCKITDANNCDAVSATVFLYNRAKKNE